MLVEVVEHDLGNGVALEHDHESLAGAAGGLITDVGDSGKLAFFDELGDLLGEVIRVYLVWQLGDNEARTVVQLFDVDDGAHGDRAATSRVGIDDALAAEDGGAGRKVWALDAFDHRGLKLFGARVRVGQEPLGSVGHLAQVVRRNVGCHTDRDTDRAVDQQVRDAARQDGRLLGAAVVVVLKVDGVFVDVTNHLERELGHAALGVSRGRCWVVARRTKVALARN